MAKPRLLLPANSIHSLPPEFGHAIPICGAVEEIDRVVLAVLGDATLTCDGVTEQLGASCGAPCPLKATEQEKVTVPENPVAGVIVIAALAPEPGAVTVSAAGMEDALKGATAAKATELDAI